MDDAMPSIQASKCFVSFANLCVFAGAAQRESKLPSSLLGHGDGEGGAKAAEGGLDEGLPGGEVGDTAGLGPVGAPIVGEGAVGEDAATSTTSLARGSSSGFATVTV